MNSSRDLTQAGSGASHDEPECPFCGDELDVYDTRPGEVFGHCQRCRESVVVPVSMSFENGPFGVGA